MIQGLLPESSQLQARIYVYLFKIGLGGLLFAFYAGMVGLRGMLGVLAGLAYAFSDYAVINAQWDLLHATEVYVFAALVLLLEAWCRDQRVAWALLIGVLLGLSHPFNLFTSAFFSLGYLAARTLVIRPGWSITEWARRLGILFAGVLAGVMVMAPICLPNLIQFLDSPRVMGDHSPLRVLLRQVISVNGGDILFSSAAGIFGKGILGVGNNFRGILNFLEAPGFYVGLPFLLLSTQLLSGNARTEERRLLWFAMAFIRHYPEIE